MRPDTTDQNIVGPPTANYYMAWCAENLPPVVQRWTTTPPKIKGWYWNCKPGETPMLTLVAHLDSQWMQKERRYWLGPLPVPEAPGVDWGIINEPIIREWDTPEEDEAWKHLQNCPPN